MNRSEAKEILDLLVAAWPSVDMPANTAGLWLKVLGSFDAAAGRAAAESVIDTEKYFPTIARFREGLASATRDHQREWTGGPGCPSCQGLGVVKDDQGRDWLCRCGSFERRPKVLNAVTSPPAELLEAARAALPKMLDF